MIDGAQNLRQIRSFIALGSNLEKPRFQVERGLGLIAQSQDMELVNFSGLYSTEPMGPADQPGYVNAVCEILTLMTAGQLLDALQAIEQKSGRQRNGVRWGARTLDLDILLYADNTVATSRLTIPHPGLLERSFVLIPLLEIDPEIEVPGAGAAADFLPQVTDYGIKRLDDATVLQNLPG